MTATVLVVPLVLITMLLVIQFALAYYARTVVAGSAQDAAAAAARRGSSTVEGIALADSLVEQGAGSLLESHSVTAAESGRLVSVTVQGKVVSLLPLFGTITVSATGTAPVETFVAQGAEP
ncbi:MAG: hypothetical protein CL424_10885 [Acidimicrobiaceae bacterium]|nr:hypothetical protein [Acidimicrobiaceae bacterium]